MDNKTSQSKTERAEQKEREAHERGKALPFYARKVVKELMTPARPGITPSKRG